MLAQYLVCIRPHSPKALENTPDLVMVLRTECSQNKEMNTNSASMRLLFLRSALSLCSVVAMPQLAPCQQNGRTDEALTANSKQLASILGLAAKVSQLRALRTRDSDPPTATMDEVLVRQELLEAIQAAALEVDSVLAELTNERGQLADLRASLQSRRDRTVNRLNAAALMTGSGLGAAVSATQFTTLSSRTQNVGDSLGIGSGIASTIFALLAVRKQAGPSGTVGETPNMLAPLLGSQVEAVLSSYYPDSVMQYLRSIPETGDPKRGTRLEQLMEQWTNAGRLDPSDSVKRQQKIAVLSTSMDSKVKISIDDLTDRIAMLTDVSGRVLLMKRDLAVLLRACSST